MFQTNPLIRCALAGLLCLTLVGCGKANEQAPALNAVNKHAASWLVGHRSAYQAAPGQCTECHGADLTGGITKIDCFNQGNLPSCHAGGHGPRRVAHHLPYRDPALHGPAAKHNLIDCQVCHGAPGGPGSNPRFNLTVGSLSSGCETAGCHNSSNPSLPALASAHPVPWRAHGSSENQSSACTLCHGADFGGVPSGGVGPACRSCHTSLAPGALPVAGSCLSCHGKPPATGAHLKHLALSGVSCPSCHSGAGARSANHGNGSVTVAFAAGLGAKTGLPAISGTRSCSAVICHGGIATPLWSAAGSINLATDCLKCHTDATATPSSPPQFNSFASGRHALHVGGIGLACTDCHDMTLTLAGASHLGGLATPAFELPASASLRGYLNYNAGARSCTPPGIAPSGNSIGACHADQRSW
jgi:predicted CxxxxCH...CXXCH cytochrome family protein